MTEKIYVLVNYLALALSIVAVIGSVIHNDHLGVTGWICAVVNQVRFMSEKDMFYERTR